MVRQIRLGVIVLVVLALAGVVSGIAASASGGAPGVAVRPAGHAPGPALAAAAGNTTTVSIHRYVQLVKGPAAKLWVTYSCFPIFYGYGQNTYGSASLVDLKGHRYDTRFAVQCDDKYHTLGLIMQGVFIKGDGAVNAVVCGFDCNGTSREVLIL